MTDRRYAPKGRPTPHLSTPSITRYLTRPSIRTKSKSRSRSKSRSPKVVSIHSSSFSSGASCKASQHTVKLTDLPEALRQISPLLKPQGTDDSIEPIEEIDNLPSLPEIEMPLSPYTQTVERQISPDINQSCESLSYPATQSSDTSPKDVEPEKQKEGIHRVHQLETRASTSGTSRVQYDPTPSTSKATFDFKPIGDYEDVWEHFKQRFRTSQDEKICIEAAERVIQPEYDESQSPPSYLPYAFKPPHDPLDQLMKARFKPTIPRKSTKYAKGKGSIKCPFPKCKSTFTTEQSRRRHTSQKHVATSDLNFTQKR